ncbi:MAG TPA: hypothetical protein VFL86_10720, partial [Burkholderiaceae bacterium]|nr:hypothetical protein [Burkholderiaceae bacterium]
DVLKDATTVAAKAGPGVSPARAAEAMRMAVIEGQLGADLDPADKARMIYALYGVRQATEALDGLAPLLAATPSFQSLPPEQTWRMVLDRSAWDDGRHAGLRFENEPGYMGGMYNGLTHVLKAHQQGHPLDAAMLEDVHDAATRGVFQMRVTLRLLGEHDVQCAARRTGPEGAAGVGLAEKNCRFESGFRDLGAVTFGLHAGDNVTRAGLKEYFVNQALHPDMQRCSMAAVDEQGKRTLLRSASDWDGKRPLVLHGPALSRSQHIDKAGAIIAHYRKELPRATTEDAKLATIASCVQQLEQAHLFMDGNARTTGFLVLNKLLLENGLSPAMIADPNRFDGCSTRELVQEIRQGQQAFAAHCRT